MLGATGSTEAELAGCDRDAVGGDVVAEYIRSDNGPEFVTRQLRDWLQGLRTNPLYIEPGSPWENRYCESFNGKLREECLNGEIFYSLKEARPVIEQWRQQYNRVRPHAALGYKPPSAGDLYPTLEPTSKASSDNVIGLTSLGTKPRPGQSPIRATTL